MNEITVYILKPKGSDDPPIVYSEDALRMAAPLVGGSTITKWLDDDKGERKLDVNVGDMRVATLTKTVMMSTEACKPKQQTQEPSMEEGPRVMTSLVSPISKPSTEPTPDPRPDQGTCVPKILP